MSNTTPNLKGPNVIPKISKTQARLHSDNVSHDHIPDIERQTRKSSTDFSKPALVKKLFLQSTPAQMLFEHCYIRADYSLYIATKATRNQWRIGEARRIERDLNTIFEQFHSELTTTLSTLEANLHSNVPEQDRNLIFDYKREFEVPVRTGFATKLIALTIMLDRLVAIVETLEINTAMTPETADKTIRSWCTRYRRFCSTINRLRVQSITPRKSKKASPSATPEAPKKVSEETNAP